MWEDTCILELWTVLYKSTFKSFTCMKEQARYKTTTLSVSTPSVLLWFNTLFCFLLFWRAYSCILLSQTGINWNQIKKNLLQLAVLDMLIKPETSKTSFQLHFIYLFLPFLKRWFCFRLGWAFGFSSQNVLHILSLAVFIIREIKGHFLMRRPRLTPLLFPAKVQTRTWWNWLLPHITARFIIFDCTYSSSPSSSPS